MWSQSNGQTNNEQRQNSDHMEMEMEMETIENWHFDRNRSDINIE